MAQGDSQYSFKPRRDGKGSERVEERKNFRYVYTLHEDFFDLLGPDLAAIFEQLVVLAVRGEGFLGGKRVCHAPVWVEGLWACGGRGGGGGRGALNTDATRRAFESHVKAAGACVDWEYDLGMRKRDQKGKGNPS